MRTENPIQSVDHLNPRLEEVGVSLIDPKAESLESFIAGRAGLLAIPPLRVAYRGVLLSLRHCDAMGRGAQLGAGICQP